MKRDMLLLMIIVTLVALVAGEESKESEELAIYNKVFSDQQIPDVKMQENLNRLKEIYEKDPGGPNRRRRQRVITLFELSQISTKKCDRDHFEDIDEFRNDNPMNIYKYLRHSQQEQQRICEAKILAEFRKAVEAIPAPKRTELEALSEEVNKVDEEFKHEAEFLMNPEVTETRLDQLNLYLKLAHIFVEDTVFMKIATGVLNYLATKDSEQLKTLAGKWFNRRPVLVALVKKYIEPMCDTLNERLEPFAYFFKARLDIITSNDEVKKYFKSKMHCDFIVNLYTINAMELQSKRKPFKALLSGKAT